MHLAVHNLVKSFGPVRANDGVSLSFAGGQIHGLLGENGAGKSTLMKLLAGFQRPDSGEIRLNGHTLRLDSPADALAAGIGMVHQDPLDIPAFSVLENFFCAAPRRALPNRQQARTRLIALAEELGFALEPEAAIASLTVGQRQQLEIVRLLACGARCLILDEPTTGISAAQATVLFAALRELAAAGNTVLFVSHKLAEVAALCDTVSVLRAGRVVDTQRVLPQAQERLLRLMFGEAYDATEAPERSHEAGAQRSASRLSAVSTSGHGNESARHGVGEHAPRPIWQLEDVTLRDGRIDLRGLNLTIAPGSALGLAGLEGSGQQLLLRALAGLSRPHEGRLLLCGEAVAVGGSERFRRAGIHYLPADRLAEGVVGSFALADHFALQAQGAGPFIDRAGALQAARQAIERYAIKAMPTTPIAALSGGNQQRAMVALLPTPIAGLLCDQPTRGLDIASARAIWQALRARRDAGTALVFAAADLDEILDHSDHVLVFFGGQVSRPLPRAELDTARLAELIGGVGFEEVGSRQ